MLIGLAGFSVAFYWRSLTYAEQWELLPFESNYKESNYFLTQAGVGDLTSQQMCTLARMPYLTCSTPSHSLEIRKELPF